MQKIVISTCFGGFGLSQSAKDWLVKEYGEEIDGYDIPRDDARLVACVEFLGSAVASGEFAKLKVVEVPAGVSWHIEEYDGWEHIAEDHEIWS